MNSPFSRRQLLANASTGFGMAALAGLMQAESPVNRAKRFAPKARSVIFCYMSGGVSHLDSFDPKPLLEKYAGAVTAVPLPGMCRGEARNALAARARAGIPCPASGCRV